jgi:ParB-like chromosome segregation protein Spo0J
MIVEIRIDQIEAPQGLLPRIITGTREEKVQEYAEMIEEGVVFDPIKVWKRGDRYWVVDGMHRLEAHKRLGLETIKAEIIELKDELECRIEAIKANLKHGLPLQKEEKILLAQTLYKLGVSIPELKKLFGVVERTLYYWLEPVKQQEKSELKKKALELKEQGMSLREIADRLGVQKSTVEDWVNESVRFLQKFQKSDTTAEELKEVILSAAKKILSQRDYKFHSYRSLRADLRYNRYPELITDEERKVILSMTERQIDEILQNHAEELMQVYKSRGYAPPSMPPSPPSSFSLAGTQPALSDYEDPLSHEQLQEWYKGWAEAVEKEEKEKKQKTQEKTNAYDAMVEAWEEYREEVVNATVDAIRKFGKKKVVAFLYELIEYIEEKTKPGGPFQNWDF